MPYHHRSLVTLCLFAALLVAAFAADAQESLPARTVLFTLVDAGSGEPLAGAPLTATCYGTDDEKHESELTTDASGVVAIPLPVVAPRHLAVTADVPGYVPTRSAWRNGDNPDPVPDAYTLRLEKGTTIGGRILDEDGEPIADATVLLLVPSDGLRDRPQIWDYAVTTDAEGRWSFDRAPGKMDDIWVRLAHPDFVSDTMYGKTPKPPMEQLRDGTGTMVMRRGITVAGTVTDASGAPVENAVVAQGSDRFGSHYPATTTDAEGRYQFEQCGAGPMVLTVAAPGWAPDLREVQVTPEMGPVDFQLEAGHVLRVRVVDSQGAPLPGSIVVPDTWRGHRSLAGFDVNAQLAADSPLRLNREADGEGRWTWTWAPEDAVLFDVLMRGYMDVRNHALAPSEEEQVVTLNSPLQVTGRVVDAETGEALAAFTVVPGIDWGGGRTSWQRRDLKPGQDGAFECTFTYPRAGGHLLRIEAPGYIPADSRVVQDSEGQVRLEFAMQRGEGPDGVVQTADGTPVADATVYLATPQEGVYFENGRMTRAGEAVSRDTDEEGRFSFPPQTGPFTLVALADAGVVEVDGADLGTPRVLTLKPWGRIEGELRIGAEPGAGEAVAVYFERAWTPDAPQVSYNYHATADETGAFVLERVLPGAARVARQVSLGSRGTASSHAVSVNVEAGQTTRVALGGTGRPVVGRLTVPDGLAVDFNCGMRSLHLVQPDPPMPESLKDDPEKAREWYAEWETSPAGKAYREGARAYAFAADANGTFRIDDVPGGTYTLSVQLFEPPAGSACGWGDTLARVSREVVVPETDGPRSDAAHDLGEVALEPVARLDQGAQAPGFKATTLDGDPLTLEQFRGKYVLVDFWAVWCGPCRAETPHLKNVWEHFGTDDRFAVVGLSLDPDVDAPRAYTEENGLGWTHGFLGEWSKTDIPTAWAVEGIPSIFLVDPDGAIIAKDLRGPDIEAAVAKALRK